MRIPVETVEDWTRRLLVASGLREADGALCAEVFRRASLRGIGHHDISYLPQRLDWLHGRRVNPTPELTCFNSGPVFENWDGDCGLGELSCGHIARRAIALAKTNGMGFCTVRRSNHFLAAFPYAELGMEAGCLLVVWSNTDAGMSAPGGVKNFIGNNPVGFGLGQAQGEHLAFDSCMANSSLGNLKALADGGQPIPPWWGVDAGGSATSSPQAVLEGGAIHPLGGHKGFGLALLHECLTGLLGQGTTFDQVSPGGGINTHNQAVLAFDLERFGGQKHQEAQVALLIQRMRHTDPQVRIPGERSASRAREQQAQGLDLGRSLWESLGRWSTRLGVAIPGGVGE